MESVKVGLVGAGIYGTNLIKFIQKIDELVLVAVSDIDETKFNTLRELVDDKIKISKDYMDIINDNSIEAVIIATPNYLHAEMAIRAMDAKKAVYLEKPVATNWSDCMKVYQKQKVTKVPLMVGMQLRYGTVYQKVKSYISDGVIGNVKMMWYKEFRSPFFPGYEGWRLSGEKSGGMLIEKNVHHFDLFNWFSCSKPKYITAFGGNDSIYSDIDIMDNAIVCIEYENGVKACLGASMFSAGCDNDIDFYIVGTKGVMSVKSDRIIITSNITKAVHEYKINQPFSEMGHGGTEYSALKDFVEVVKGNKEPLTGIYEGIISVRMAFSADESISKRQVVVLNDNWGINDDNN